MVEGKGKHWKILKSEVALDNTWYKVRKDQVQLPDGTIIDDFYVSELRDVSLVFPVTPKKDVIFVSQYKHGPQEVLLELPGGTYKRGAEDPETAARRELEEETGYNATKPLILLGQLYDYPTKDSHMLRIYLAEDVQYLGRRYLNPTEDIDIVTIPIDETLDLIQQQRVKVTGTIAGIVLANNYLKGAR